MPTQDSTSHTEVPSELRVGSRGDRVRELQLLMLFTGVGDPGKPDGIFGPLTLAAVQGAQLAVGLPAGDAVDDELLRVLRARPRRHVQVPRARTPAAVAELRRAVNAGYETTFTRPTNPLAVRVALAQLAVEHGAGYSAIWLFNLGNQASVPPWLGPFCYLVAPEVIGDKRVEVSQPLRAYATLDEGGAGYWQRLREGYPWVLPSFEMGDPGQAAELLKGLERERDPSGDGYELRKEHVPYYTEDVRKYRVAMVDRFAALGGHDDSV